MKGIGATPSAAQPATVGLETPPTRRARESCRRGPSGRSFLGWARLERAREPAWRPGPAWLSPGRAAPGDPRPPGREPGLGWRAPARGPTRTPRDPPR